MKSLIQTLHDISLGLFVNSLYSLTHANGDISDKIMLVATTLAMLGANLYKRNTDGSK